ncbi:MAG: TIGR02757 family protein [Prevotella sp.]|nr:TIGR02757 family protein [Prevotella sp.]
MTQESRDLLIKYAAQYETADFLEGDPSWFMHQVTGVENQEAMAFISSCLSYGNRQQFMKKTDMILSWSGGKIDQWVRSGDYEQHFRPGDKQCFYRLYNHDTMYHFLHAYQQLLKEHGTLGNHLRHQAHDGLSAVESICRYFSQHGISVVVPKDTQSACKRVCMFLRWMVRSDSPVDLGLWSDFIDRRTLIIPMDTHVLQQSVNLGLLSSKTATMSTARRLTEALAEIFPDDPLKGDFALFGHGVNNK